VPIVSQPPKIEYLRPRAVHAVNAPSHVMSGVRLTRMPSLNFLHLVRQPFRRENLFAEKNVRERHDPAFVIGKCADNFDAERFDAAALLLCIDQFVIVEHIGERVAALLPRKQLVFHALDGAGGESTPATKSNTAPGCYTSSLPQTPVNSLYEAGPELPAR